MIAYQCQHSGLYYPEDYVKMWGVDGYGVGLGPVPVSDALSSNYLLLPEQSSTDPQALMHPVGVVRSPLVRVTVTEEAYDANKAILNRDDPMMRSRAALMRIIQRTKSPKLDKALSQFN